MQVGFIPNGLREINSTSINCNCVLNPSCQSQAVIYDARFHYVWENDIDLIYNVSGWNTGCLTIDSLQFSTLECFYVDSNCFPLVLSYLLQHPYFLLQRQSYSVRVKPLVYDPTLNSFPPKTSISRIIRELMVDQWNPSSSYESFYDACAPIYCSYSQRSRKENFLGVVRTLVSTIGGIVVCLRILTPQLMRVILGFSTTFKRQPERGNLTKGHSLLWQELPYVSTLVHRTLIERLTIMIRNVNNLLQMKLIELNLFTLRDLGSEVDRITARRFGVWATRLYFLLYIVALVLLAFYPIVRPYTLTKDFDQPSFLHYNQLKEVYGDALKCRCTAIASPYNRFVEITPVFHSVRRYIF